MTTERQRGHGARHLVGDVQRFGLLSAATIVDRYIEIVDRATTDNGFRGDTTPLPSGGPPDWLADTAAAMAKSFLTLVDATASLVESRTTQQHGSPGIERICLPPAPAGSCSEAVLWFHNPAESPAETALHTTSLASSSGDAIPRGAISLRPDPLEPVAPGTAQRVRLLVQVPPDQPAGQYHGLVLGSASACEPIAVHLDVLPHVQDAS